MLAHGQRLADDNHQSNASPPRQSALAKQRTELNRILASRSWRMTRPLRFGGRLLRGEWPLVLAGLRLAFPRVARALHMESPSDSDLRALSPTDCRIEVTAPQQASVQSGEKIHRPPLDEWRIYDTIVDSGLFDNGWYLENNADVAASGMDPILHYVMHGAQEMRDPCPAFSTADYLQRNTGAATAGVNPFAHFILHGAIEERKTIPEFTTTTTNNNKLINIISTKHTLFVAHSIDYYLSTEGYDVSIMENYDNKFDPRAIYVVICPQAFPELPPEFITFQMEQSTNDRWFTEEYKGILSNSIAILDYSLNNISYLNKFISSHRLFHIPIDPIEGYLSYLTSRRYKLNLSPENCTEVMFYGDVNCPRRFEFLQRVREKFNVKVICGIFGEDLINEVISTRLVINVHYYDIALLETTRICEALSIGVPVISEESADIEQYEELRTVVEFTRMGDPEAMMEAIDRLLSDEDLYKERLVKIRSFVSKKHRFRDYFKRLLVAQGKYSYQRFQETSSLLPHLMPTTPRICLSVPEYTTRRSAFIGKNRDFLLFDGVRYHPGWIGASMSYKYIFSKLIDTSCSRITICEDDVVFDGRFSERLSVIERFLDSTHYRWDIFSGLIAELHPDTKISRIVQFEDQEFIFINKMTSNVFNIYNRSSFVKIALWDEKNMDVTSNIIDRYIEAANDLVIVTTLPFLVGHDEYLTSSIWDFQNSAYVTMFEKCQKLLEKKISEFKEKAAFCSGHDTFAVHQ